MSNTEALRAAAHKALAAMEKYPVTVNHWKAVLLPAADALRAALAQQPAADHVPAGPDAEAATDAALGLVLLPPIRVSEKAHTMLQRIASGHGMPLQAVVRYALEPGEVMGAAQQPAASGEPVAWHMRVIGCDGSADWCELGAERPAAEPGIEALPLVYAQPAASEEPAEHVA